MVTKELSCDSVIYVRNKRYNLNEGEKVEVIRENHLACTVTFLEGEAEGLTATIDRFYVK